MNLETWGVWVAEINVVTGGDELGDLEVEMDEYALKQINRLALENGRMRFLIGEAITTMNHAETFIRTREKMHPTGIGLWSELVSRLQECLDEQNKRCSGCGGSLPVTGKSDRTGECTCQ